MDPLVDARAHSGLVAISNPPFRAREAAGGCFPGAEKIA